MIPADHFYLHFHSDASTEDWGYKLTATAPVSMESAAKLKAEGKLWDEIQCQMALQRTNNNYEAAVGLLLNNKGVVPGAVAATSEAAVRVAGLFCDRTGAVQVNLQTSEVYLQNRECEGGAGGHHLPERPAVHQVRDFVGPIDICFPDHYLPNSHRYAHARAWLNQQSP